MPTECLLTFLFVAIYAPLANHFSYRILKRRILRERKWDLNICCGKTDGGGINVDIVCHLDLPRYQQVQNIYNLPFEDGAFGTVLCSHTMEHVDDPVRFDAELRRVGREVTIVIPPLYDIAAVLNVFEHRWIFLTFRKKHHKLPRHVRLPFSRGVQRRFGQKIRA